MTIISVKDFRFLCICMIPSRGVDVQSKYKSNFNIILGNNSIYPCLNRLYKSKWLESEKGNGREIYYKITTKGAILVNEFKKTISDELQ